MGAGIAAQIANSSTKVLLFDIASNEKDRSSITKQALTKMLVTKPEPLSHPSKLDLITPCNLEDDLEKIRECDLVIEAIVENINIKQELYKKLLPYLKKNVILSSNTSTLNLHLLKQELPKSITTNFIILHFFNPPRYMPLLELVTDDETNHETKKLAIDFASRKLGKEVVECRDTPGFIANRIGCFFLELSLNKALEYNIDIEIIDYIMHKYLYLPNTGVFGLYDLIGIDVMRLISTSLLESLPNDDKFPEIYKNHQQISQMIDQKYTGRKGLGGFYRIKNIDGTKIKEVINLTTMEYSKCKDEKYDFGRNINDVLSLTNNIGMAIKDIIIEFGSYVISIAHDICDNIYDIDKVMRLGYNWKYGPFELFYSVIKDGFKIIEKSQHNPYSFIKTEEYKNIDSKYFLSETNNLSKYNKKYLLENDSCKLSLLKNDSLCFSISTKMNCLNHEIFTTLSDAISYAQENNKRLYIYSDSYNFSAGANLNIFLDSIDNNNWRNIEEFITLGQDTMQKIKHSSIEVISCASGAALGGGSELLLHSSLVYAHQQLSAGLVESNLGLIPAFGGTKEMVIRGSKSETLLVKNLKNIVFANKTSSADHFSYDYDIKLYVNMNRSYLLEEALEITDLYPITIHEKQMAEKVYILPKFDLEKEIDFNSLDKHRIKIANYLQSLSGMKVNENNLLDFEREIFMKLISTEEVRFLLGKIIK